MNNPLQGFLKPYYIQRKCVDPLLGLNLIKIDTASIKIVLVIEHFFTQF